MHTASWLPRWIRGIISKASFQGRKCILLIWCRKKIKYMFEWECVYSVYVNTLNRWSRAKNGINLRLSSVKTNLNLEVIWLKRRNSNTLVMEKLEFKLSPRWFAALEGSEGSRWNTRWDEVRSLQRRLCAHAAYVITLHICIYMFQTDFDRSYLILKGKLKKKRLWFRGKISHGLRNKRSKQGFHA